MESNDIERARLELLRAQHDLEREKVTADIETSKAASDLAKSQFDAEHSKSPYRANPPWLAPSLGFLGGVLGSLGAVYTGLLDVEVRDRAVDVQEMRITFEMLQVPREQVGVDVSRFCAAPSARLSHLPFESDGAFPTSAEWRRRGL